MNRLPTLAALLLVAMPLQAKVSPEEAGRLGRELTPMGAERAGNADGSIPAWDGGLTQRAVDPQKGYEDPYAGDAPLFTITAQNYKQYESRLTPGQVQIFRNHADFKMPVYPTRRSAAFPKGVYDAVKKNALRAELTGTDTLTGAVTGPAFPIPRSGAEAIWNHRTKYVGAGIKGYYNAAVVSRGGEYFIARVLRYVSMKYNQIGIEPGDLKDNIFLYYLTYVLSPTRLAGNIVLVHQTIDQVKQPNMAWVYNPGQRRVRRAPELGYDNPTLATDSLGTQDQIDIFNGALDRYNWKLVGKREIYIPYNSYKLEKRGLKAGEIIKPGHINQDLARYELHRVWVIDATVKDGIRHLYKRRTFYADEDSWHLAFVDCYDMRDELWRIQEGHLMNIYNVPAVTSAVEVGYDFKIGRYVVGGLENEEEMTDLYWRADDGHFTPAAMRMHGIQ
jgi:hypothetical protein